MAARVSIIVRFDFEGIHSWPDATAPVAFLAFPHRHVFHVEAAKDVTHDDRQIEIIQFKKELSYYCRMHYAGPHLMSCEMMARELLMLFGLRYCRVLEDGENGAEAVVDA
jgi:hypothetical protein